MAHLKGQNVNLLIYDETQNKYVVIAGSKSCDFSVTANTADAASKDDEDPMWDNPAFTYCDWSASNESFLVEDLSLLKMLLDKMVNGDCSVKLQWQAGASTDAINACKCGTAVITSLDLDAPCDDNLSLSLSFEGASALTNGTFTTITKVSGARSKVRGKSMMIAVCETVEGIYKYHTICASKSHKLSLSAQTADTKTKDSNDKAISKEITGKSLSLSTENLVTLHGSGADRGTCKDVFQLLDTTLNGTTLKLVFGYYPDAVGKDVNDGKGGSGQSAKDNDWGTPDELTISGDFLCTSWSMNAANKEDASATAEFSLQGKPSISVD